MPLASNTILPLDITCHAVFHRMELGDRFESLIISYSSGVAIDVSTASKVRGHIHIGSNVTMATICWLTSHWS
jgi:hypothetical protein